MSENDEFEPEVINPNLTQDDVLSLSAVYGLTLNKRQKETAMKNDKLNQKYAGGSTPDLRLLQNQSSTHTTPARSIHSTGRLESIENELRYLRDENTALKKEAAVREAKLQANIRSIKTFWSPELKKERNARKEEQLRANRLQTELQYQTDERPDSILIRENNVLRRAVADLEARVLAQRETLEAREISLRRALQLASSYENSKCGIQSEETLRSLLNIKDDKIAALEKCIKELEGQIRSRGTLGNEDSQLLNAHNNFLKTQSDGLKCELSVREAEISSLKTRLESTERTNQENRMHLEALRESLSAKTNRCTALQEEVGRLRDKTGEAKVAQNAQSSADREELIVKERKIELFKEKVKSLQEQLNEKEKYICDLETKLKFNQGNKIVEEKNYAESNMAIKALEDALREKDQAMERERDRFNKELDGERKKRNDLEIQVNNPEEVERERQQYRQELKSSQKQISIIQQTLSNTDQRAAKAESTSARLSSQMEELLKEFQHTKSAYNTLQQKYEKMRRLRTEDKKILQNAKTEATNHCLNELEMRAELLDLKGKTQEAKHIREQLNLLAAQINNPPTHQHNTTYED